MERIAFLLRSCSNMPTLSSPQASFESPVSLLVEAAGSKSSSHAQPAYKQAVNEMIRCIEVAADFEDQIRLGQKSSNGRRTWVAVKMVSGARNFINAFHCIATLKLNVSFLY